MIYFLTMHRPAAGWPPGTSWRVELEPGRTCRLDDGTVFPLDFGAMCDALASGAATLTRRPPLEVAP